MTSLTSGLEHRTEAWAELADGRHFGRASATASVGGDDDDEDEGVAAPGSLVRTALLVETSLEQMPRLHGLFTSRLRPDGLTSSAKLQVRRTASFFFLLST